jgi:hypothetical protein
VISLCHHEANKRIILPSSNGALWKIVLMVPLDGDLTFRFLALCPIGFEWLCRLMVK